MQSRIIWLDCNMGKLPRIVHIPYRYKIEQPDTDIAVG